MEKEEIQEKLKEVRIAIKVLCFLYPEVGGHLSAFDRPKHAWIVLRRFQQRERDLLGFLECVSEPLNAEEANLAQ